MKLKFILSPSLSIDLLVFVRVFIGILIIKHGFILFDAEAMAQSAGFFENIHIPLPTLMAYVAKSTEFFGGIFLALGLFTHITAAILVFNMLVALGTAFGFNIFEGEIAFLFLLLFIVFAVVGGGKYSLDYFILKK
ncbi:MAG: DoxX family protein [Tannerella sp.]|jgi:putative oxidoreductase|nr:DoxX family protein [Tannerella sp.]